MVRGRFAGYVTKSTRGISSELPLYSPEFWRWVVSQDVGLIFTPTVTQNPPLSDADGTYPRIHVAEVTGERHMIVSRPLSSVLREALELREIVKGGSDVYIFSSIAATSLNEWADFIDKVESGGFDGIEVDIPSMSAISNVRKREFELYTVDLLGEISSMTMLPVTAKIELSQARNLRYLEDLAKVGVKGLTITPHMMYSVGRHLFRVHSSDVSRISLRILAGLISEFPDMDIAYVSDGPFSEPPGTHLLAAFNIVLYDFSALKAFLKRGLERYVQEDPEKRLPLYWRKVSKDLRLVVRSDAAATCSEICPYRAIPREAPKGEFLANVDESCDLCGLCLSLCSDSISFARVLHLG